MEIKTLKGPTSIFTEQAKRVNLELRGNEFTISIVVLVILKYHILLPRQENKMMGFFILTIKKRKNGEDFHFT